MTSQPIRFLFDECFIGQLNVERDLAQSLALLGVDVELAHILSKFPLGTEDADWIPKIAQEGWIVVSFDRGKNSKKSEKLPLICRAFGVTHVLGSRGLQLRSAYYRIEAINSSWPLLLNEVAVAPRGTGYSLGIHTGKRHVFSFRLKKTYDPSLIDDNTSKHQQTPFNPDSD